jgi:hypothetical protein
MFLAILFLLAVGFGKMLAIAVICLAVGFGIGRIKNSVKLAKIKDELGSIEHWASSEARGLYTKISSHL